MRVIHVVPTIEEEAAGPSYSVPRTCESLIRTKVDVQLVTLEPAPESLSLPYLKTFPLSFGPRRLGPSTAMRRWLQEEAASRTVDLIHVQGLWMMPNVYPGRACRRGRCRVIVSPRGMLSTWALKRNAFQKKVFWRFLQAPVLRFASCFHATAESECEDIRRLGFKQPVCILPNGIDLPGCADKVETARRKLLFLGRIHPKKGVDILLRSWQQLAKRFPDWELEIAGPDNGGYLAEMQTLAAQLRLDRVNFQGPLYGEAKWRAYRGADLFVLPTHSENFGLTVAESLAAGTPAIVSKGAPWSGLESHGAGWWIDGGVERLVACLMQSMALPATRLAEMGRSGREWMKREYSWERIGTQLSVTYRWLIEGGETPPWVKLS